MQALSLRHLPNLLWEAQYTADVANPREQSCVHDVYDNLGDWHVGAKQPILKIEESILALRMGEVDNVTGR